MTLPEALLKILVCPVDKGCLMYFADEDLLYNPRLRRAYRIEKGVPVMLPDQADSVPEREHERLITRARDGAADVSAAGLARGGRDDRWGPALSELPGGLPLRSRVQFGAIVPLRPHGAWLGPDRKLRTVG